MRTCGGCTLCCKLVPVEQIGKLAGQKCEHQTSKGCAVYATRPFSCRFWSCRWLIDPATHNIRRPDRVHYVIDEATDEIGITYRDTGERITVPVIQVWVDPDYPDAHKDPALRNYLEAKGEEGYAALIRYSSHDALVLFPPAMTPTGDFHERETNVRKER